LGAQRVEAEGGDDDGGELEDQLAASVTLKIADVHS
jgi:hypothetical protein